MNRKPANAALSLHGDGWVRTKPTRIIKLEPEFIAAGKAEAKRLREIADEAQIRELTRIAAQRLELVKAGMRTTEQVRRDVDRMAFAIRSFERRYGRAPKS